MTTLFTAYPDVITIQQLQDMLQVGRNTAYQLLKTGQIKTIKTSKSGKYIILKKNVIDYLTNQETLCYTDSVHCFNSVAQ